MLFFILDFVRFNSSVDSSIRHLVRRHYLPYRHHPFRHPHLHPRHPCDVVDLHHLHLNLGHNLLPPHLPFASAAVAASAVAASAASASVTLAMRSDAALSSRSSLPLTRRVNGHRCHPWSSTLAG